MGNESMFKNTPEPRLEDLRLPDYEITVLWYSGSFEDAPAVMSIKEFCQHWCPKKLQKKEEATK